MAAWRIFLIFINFSFFIPSLQAWTPQEESFFREKCGGVPVRYRYNPQKSSLDCLQISPEIYGIAPRSTPPSDLILGTMENPILECFVENDHDPRVVTFHGRFELQAGSWRQEEDRENRETRFFLPLGFFLNGQWNEVFSIERRISHQGVSHEETDQNTHESMNGACDIFEYRGGNHFYGVQKKDRGFRGADGQEYYQRVHGDRIYPPGHSNRPLYVEPLTPEGQVPDETREGDYERLEANHLALPDRGEGRLLYSDGSGSYFIPQVTQDLWQYINKGETSRRVFFIASKNPKKCVQFVRGVTLPFTLLGGRGFLREGLYQLMGIESQGTHERPHLEWWRPLNQEGNPEERTFKIQFPSCYPSSIPGMGGTAPRILPSRGGILNSVATLQREIHGISQKVERQRSAYPQAKYQVIVLGATGVGKSALITGLAGRKLEAVEKYPDDDESPLCFETDNPLPNIQIHRGAAPGTDYPTAWYDEFNQTIYWDCPGFGDPSGEEKDIINAFSIFQAFHGCSRNKVLFVISYQDLMGGDRWTGFYHRLGLLRSLFAIQKEFEEALGFVVTGFTPPSSRINQSPKKRIEKAYGDFCSAEGLKDQERILPLFKHLHENLDRLLFSFNMPGDVGDYEFDQEGLKNLLEELHWHPMTPDLTPLIKDAGVHLEGLALQFNNHMKDFIKYEVSQKILYGCRRKIELHQGTVQTLRASFKDMVQKLSTLSQAKDRGSFFKQVQELLGPENMGLSTDGMGKVFAQGDFFNRLGVHVQESFEKWGRTLMKALKGPLDLLTQTPTFLPEHISQNILTLSAPFLGISDVKAICEKASHPFSFVRVFVGGKFFFDGDVSLRGKHLSIVGPMGHVSQACTIDLSGLDGKDGAHGSHGTFPGGHGGHGSPGEPGGNGGNFVAFFHDVQGQAKDLTINLSGGKGGRGGNGGNGAPGANGHTENRPTVPTDEAEYQNFITRIKNPREIFSENTIDNFYRFCPSVNIIKGKEGSRGGNGGKAGVGSQGGLEGYDISWSLRGAKIIKKPVNTGSRDGQPGQGGNGGQHGKDVVVHTYLSNEARRSDCPIKFDREKVLNPQYRAVKGKRIRYMKDPDSLKPPTPPFTPDESYELSVNFCNRWGLPNKQLESFRNLYPQILASLDQNRGRAPSGQAGQGVNGQPRGPGPRIEVGISQLQRAFDTFYIEAAQKDALAPFLGFPPSFEEEDGAPNSRR